MTITCGDKETVVYVTGKKRDICGKLSDLKCKLTVADHVIFSVGQPQKRGLLYLFV